MCTEQIIDILKALLTPAIGICTIFIAYQQLKTNRQNLQYNKYNRMLHVYEEVKKILRILSTTQSLDDLIKFLSSISEADFLFKSDITQYIDEIYKHGVEIWTIRQKYQDYPRETPQDVINKFTEELKWIVDQFDIAKAKFKPYLDMSK